MKYEAEDCIQTTVDNFQLYCPERLNFALEETVRLARLGAAVEQMHPNQALFKHNDDTWNLRCCVMDGTWRIKCCPEDPQYRRTPMEALQKRSGK